MRAFIAVTDSQDQLHLINTGAIERVRPYHDGSQITFRGGTAAGDPRTMTIKEPFAQLYNQLLD